MLSKNRMTTLGKFIALVLRHQPEVAEIILDPQGWGSVEKLLVNKAQPMTWEELEEVVAQDNKGRYAFNEDKTKIRAVQGHSLAVDAGEKPCTPPNKLFHGTAPKNVDSILREGLLPQSRNYVHLSKDRETAITVGRRHSKGVEPTILEIDARHMSSNGYAFYVSENEVYLSKEVPANYITV